MNSAMFNQTLVQPAGLAVVIALGFAMILVPRRHALLPVIALVSFIPVAQRIVIAGFDFDFLRLMVLFGWARILLRREYVGFRFKTIDWWQFAVVGIGTFVFIAQRGDSASVVFRLGYAFDAIGMYFLFRMLLRGWADVDRVVRAFIVLSIPVAVVFFIEWSTRRNMFSIFGGVPAVTAVRDGRLRCQGAFGHPIIAGCFWATALPLFAARWVTAPRERWLTGAGMAAAVFIVFTTSSSTPAMAVIFTALGLAMFAVRGWMRVFRWGALATLVLLQLLMQGPVWSLIAKINIISGSTGWHRYNLIDQAINRIGEWWLLGTQSTADWGAYGQLRDVTNQYVFEAVTGGIWTLLAFAGLLFVAFRGVSAALRGNRGKPKAEWVAWCVGVTLFVHVMNFIALTYFAQMVTSWLLTLAIVGAITPVARRSARVRGPVVTQARIGGRALTPETGDARPRPAGATG